MNFKNNSVFSFTMTFLECQLRFLLLGTHQRYCQVVSKKAACSSNSVLFVFIWQLAGIDKPNDGKCHLVKHGNKGEYIYSEELTQV